MAYKEEKTRIYILKVPVCKDKQTQEQDWEKCRCYINDTGFCKHHPKCKHSLTRQEAIEVMAKAISGIGFVEDGPTCWAEAALNALLGVEK